LDDVDERIEDISESKKLRTEDGNIQTFTLEDEDAKIKKVINLDFYDLVRTKALRSFFDYLQGEFARCPT